MTDEVAPPAPAPVEAPPVLPTPESVPTPRSGDVQAWIDIGAGLSETDRAEALRYFAETPLPTTPTEVSPPTMVEADTTTNPALIEADPTTNPALAEAQKAVREGRGTRADLDLIDKAKAEAVSAKKSERESKALAEASKAYAEGRATDRQIALVRADTEKRAKAAAAEKKSDHDKLNERIGNGETLSAEEEARRNGYEAEKGNWETLVQRAESGEELSDDEKQQLEEGNEVWGEKEDVAESEVAKLERMHAELKAETDAMLLEADPEKRATMLAQIAEKNGRLLGIGHSKEQADRDRKVIREVLEGKRKDGLTSEKAARNERMHQLMDQILGDAAELLKLTQQMEAVDQQREAIKKKIQSEKVRLGMFSTPMEKFIKVQTIIPLHRQLQELDDRMVQISNGADVFASRYYRNMLALRSSQRIRGVFGRIVDSVSLNTLAYTADIKRYTKSASRALIEL